LIAKRVSRTCGGFDGAMLAVDGTYSKHIGLGIPARRDGPRSLCELSTVLAAVLGADGSYPELIARRIVVGLEEARSRAGLRPPLKLHVRFARMQLSRRHITSRCKKREHTVNLSDIRQIEASLQYPRTRTYGFFAKRTDPPSSSLLIWLLVSPCLSSPATFPDPLWSPITRSRGFHRASGNIWQSDY
jgi:hypothetical protein